MAETAFLTLPDSSDATRPSTVSDLANYDPEAAYPSLQAFSSNNGTEAPAPTSKSENPTSVSVSPSSQTPAIQALSNAPTMLPNLSNDAGAKMRTTHNQEFSSPSNIAALAAVSSLDTVDYAFPIGTQSTNRKIQLWTTIAACILTCWIISTFRSWIHYISHTTLLLLVATYLNYIALILLAPQAYYVCVGWRNDTCSIFTISSWCTVVLFIDVLLVVLMRFSSYLMLGCLLQLLLEVTFMVTVRPDSRRTAYRSPHTVSL